jgi:two-component system sensor kinase FixL
MSGRGRTRGEDRLEDGRARIIDLSSSEWARVSGTMTNGPDGDGGEERGTMRKLVFTPRLLISSGRTDGDAEEAPLDGEFAQIFRCTAQIIFQSLHSDASLVFEFAPESRQLVLRAGLGWEEMPDGRAFSPVIADPMAPILAADSAQQLCFAVGAAYPKFAQYLKEQGIVAGAGALIRDREGAIGAICAYSRHRLSFDDADYSVLRSMALLVGTSMGQLRMDARLGARREALEQEDARRAAYVELLKRVAIISNEAASIDEAFKDALGVVCSLMEWPLCRAFLRDVGDGFDLLNAWVREENGRFKPLNSIQGKTRYALGEGLVGVVAATGCPQSVTHLGRGHQLDDCRADHPCRPTFAFPVLTGRRVVAVLEFDGEKAIEPDREFLEVMAQIGTQLGRVVERIWAEAEIRSSEERFRTIFSDAALGIALLDLDGKFVQVNPAFEAMLGYKEHELFEKPFAKILYADEAEEDTALISSLVAEGGKALHLERRHPHKDGRAVWSDFSLSVIRDAEGRPRYIAAMLQDITERKFFERRVADMVVEQERALARELHDGLGQQLVGIGMLSSVLKNKLETVNSPEASRAGEIMRNVLEAHAYVRLLSRGLHTVDVEASGLADALRQLAQNMAEASEIRFTCECDDSVLVADSNVATHLFRVAQEAVANAVRHAQATEIEIRLKSHGDRVTLQVRDNGVGFKSRGKSAGGVGLRTMRYRAGAVGAKLSIGPGEVSGTVVACSLKTGKST